MEIKLYRVNTNSNERKLKPINLEINGKIISYLEAPTFIDGERTDDGRFEQKTFTYEKDKTYYRLFEKLKLNYKIKINSTKQSEYEDFDDDYISSLEGHTHLNFINRLKIKWIFGDSWFQNSENLKYLINIIISAITAYLTTKFAS